MRILFAIIMLSTAAHAHQGQGEHSLFEGFLHPFLGFDHIAAMVMVGILAKIRLDKLDLSLPLTFAASLFLGAIATKVLGGLSFIENGILLSLPLLLWFIFKATSKNIMLLAVALTGFLHGAAHGLEAPPHNFVAFIIGIMVSTFILHSFGVFIGFLAKKRGLLQ